MDHDVGDLEPAARLEHTLDLREDRVLVGHEVNHAVRDHDVQRLVRQRELLDQPLPDLYVVEAHFGRALPRSLHHRGSHVDPDRATAGADHLRGDQQVGPRPAAEVEHGLALADHS